MNSRLPITIIWHLPFIMSPNVRYVTGYIFYVFIIFPCAEWKRLINNVYDDDNNGVFFCRLQSKRCLVLVGLVILTAVVSFLVVFSQHHAVDTEVPDPEYPLPPSFMPMGNYSKVGVVSNGGPCAQIGV